MEFGARLDRRARWRGSTAGVASLMGDQVDSERLAALKEQRTALVADLQAMLDTPQDQRPTNKTALKAWLTQLEGTQRTLEQLDRLVKMLEHQPKRRARVTTAATPTTAAGGSPDETDTVLLVRIPKGPRAELRVTVKTWKGRRVIDVRCWSPMKDTGEYGPTRKGVAVDARMLPALIEALHLAQQHA